MTHEERKKASVKLRPKMSPEEVIEILGEPDETKCDNGEMLWSWEGNDGKEFSVEFTSDMTVDGDPQKLKAWFS